jgi:hypothetical protein
MDWDETLNDIPNNRVIKLWDNTCFDIDELAQVLIGSNGQNQNPIPGNTNQIWRNREDLLEIVNFPTLEPDYRNQITTILANDLAERPPHIDIFIRNPDLLDLLAETGVLLLSDYTDDFNIGLEALGQLSDKITQKGEKDAKILFNVTNSKGKRLKKTLEDIPKNCIHGGGFNLAAYYCKIYLELEQCLGKEEMEKNHKLYQGYYRLSKISDDCILYGYPLVKYNKLGVCIYSMKKSEQLDGGTGRIGNVDIDTYKLTDNSVFGFSYSIAKQIREKILTDYKKLYNDEFVPFYMQRYYESKVAYQKKKSIKKQKTPPIKTKPKTKTKIKINKKKASPITKKDCNKDYICPKDKICNPNTGRCINRDGVLGKKLLLEEEKKQKQKDLSQYINFNIDGKIIKIDYKLNETFRSVIDKILLKIKIDEYKKKSIYLTNKELGGFGLLDLGILGNYKMEDLIRNTDLLKNNEIIVVIPKNIDKKIKM